MNKIGSVLLMLSALLLVGCGDANQTEAPLASENRELMAFSAIDVEGAARLEIAVGQPQAVVIAAPAGSLKRVKTEVRNNTLYVSSKARDWITSEGPSGVTLRVSVPALAALHLKGGNQVRITGFDGGRSVIRAEGAAHIEAVGRVDELDVQMAGAGRADFSQLIARQADVTVDGVGSVVVHPTELLNATMNGVGAIQYTGSPREVNTKMNGVGSIGRRSETEHAKAEDAPNETPDAGALQPEREDGRRRGPVAVGESTEVI